MVEEIVLDGGLINRNGKKYIRVLISNEALSQINKIVLGDKVDQDDEKQVNLRKQVHEDCLRLFKQFN